MKMKVVVSLIFFQLILISFLSYRVYQKQKNILGVVSVDPIKKENLVFKPSDKFKYFYEPKPNNIEKVNEWVPYKGTYTINSDSLNERFDYPIKKTKNIYRIITLGNSFTYGLYVDTKDNWTEQLEDRLNQQKEQCTDITKFEVMNLGMHGYDIQYLIERFKLRGIKYEADMVIWLMNDNDFFQINEIMLKKAEFYQKQMSENGELEKQIKSGNLYPAWDRALRELKTQYDKKSLEKYQLDQLTQFRKDIYRGTLLFLTFPVTSFDHKSILKDFTHSFAQTYFSDEIINIYDESRELLYFPNDGHPNQNGHKQIAENIFNILIKKKLIPCFYK